MLGGLITFTALFALFHLCHHDFRCRGYPVQYYGINPYVGRVVMSVWQRPRRRLGLNKLTKIIGRWVLIIAFVVVIGLISIFGSDTTFQEATDCCCAWTSPGGPLGGFRGLYSAFCTTTAVSFCRDGHPSQGRKNAGSAVSRGPYS